MASKTPVSMARTYRDIGAFWDEHDSTESGEQTEVEFNVHIGAQRRYYPVDGQLCQKIREAAKQRGISEETLLNLWVQEKILQTEAKASA